MKIERFNENTNNEPKINDYIIFEYDNSNYNLGGDIYDFLTNNIGRIRNYGGKVVVNGKTLRTYYVSYDISNKHPEISNYFEYENIPDIIRDYFNLGSKKNKVIHLNETNIKAFGKTIEELEMILTADKFNL